MVHRENFTRSSLRKGVINENKIINLQYERGKTLEVMPDCYIGALGKN
jgi:hypothetical protein